MPQRQPSTIPRLWLVSDARNDSILEQAIAGLPRGAGIIFRHRHLGRADRRARFAEVRRACRRRGLSVVLAGSTAEAQRWGADGAYGAPDQLGRPTGGLRLSTAHDARELAAARRARADAVLLSPVFATRSHPGTATLGSVRFRSLAVQTPLPVIALGGMTAARARALGCWGWAAIDGLSKST